MPQTLESKEVIESLQNIIIHLEKLRLNSLDVKKLHHHNRHYSFMHFFDGQSNGIFQSIVFLKIYLDRLIIKK